MKKGFFILLLLLALYSNNSWSQVNLLNAKVPQEVGLEQEEKSNPIAYGYIDDRDVLWSKVVWEFVDLNQRINLPYYFPIDTTNLSNGRRSLFDTLLRGIRRGDSK